MQELAPYPFHKTQRALGMLFKLPLGAGEIKNQNHVTAMTAPSAKPCIRIQV